ncbi:MAG TPA: glycosyltransferase, partial [Clostridiales bacterium]|nr:glycosyltransferase [Clostridiales bacterium]
IRSHNRFARDAFSKAEEISPDLIFVEIPPNSLVKQAAEYKKQHPDVRLILDLYDLWPENFPGRGLKKLFALPFSAWRRIRDDGLYAADTITLECELYRTQLEKQLTGKKTDILYLCHRNTATNEPKAPETKELGLCYLGSINNVIDIPMIAKLIGEIALLRPVTLHIIGDGESRQKLICAAQKAGAKVEFHGIIYDEAQKQAIFDQCRFGINMMKSGICVGLTMKSIDYFAGGLPVLNTIGGDTQMLVEQYGAGFNICRDDLKKTAEQIAGMTPEENRQMRLNALRMFRELFSEEAFSKSLGKIFEESI